MAKRLDCHLVFGGKEDIKDSEFYILADSLGIKDRIHFTGFLTPEELAAHYRTSIALVFPSLYERFGLPILEAMNYGCPVITSNLSSIPGIAGEAAILVNPYDSEDIAQALQQIATDTTIRDNLIQKGLNNVRRYSWETTATQTAAVYAGILSG